MSVFRFNILSLGTLFVSAGIFYFWTSDIESDLDESYQLYNKDSMKNLSAFVLGGTGGVGSSIIKALAREPRFEKVVCVGRRKIEFPESDAVFNYKKFEQQILPDFDKIVDPENLKIFKGIDVGFYTLGVSVRKVDEATYRKIEYGYASAVGKFAREGGCQHFHYVSGAAVNKNSWLLVRRVKSQIEEELRETGFPRVSIYRPAGILSNDNSGGMAGIGVVRTLRFLDRWNKLSVEAEMLGNVIVSSTFRDTDKPTEILTNAEIVQMGRKLEALNNEKQ